VENEANPTPEPPPIRRYLVLNDQGEPVNITLWDGITPWHPGEGLRAVPEPEPEAAP
jgi:hypothetical protein